MANIFLFTGENLPSLREKLRFWQQEFVKKHDASNLEHFDTLAPNQLSQLITAFQSQPFLADKRMVVVEGLPFSADQKAWDVEPLLEELNQVPDSTVLIFVSPKPDKRTRFYKQLIKLAQIEDFPLPKGRELQDWAAQRFARYSIRIDQNALQLLLFFCAEDINRISREIDKLSLLDHEHLTAEHIQTYVSATPEAKIFQVLDSIGKEPLSQLLKTFESLLNSDQEMMMIFFMMVRQFRLLVQVRSLLDKHAERGQIQKRLKLAPFQVNLLTAQAKRLSSQQLKRAYGQLCRIDQDFKTGRIPLSSGHEDLAKTRIDQFLCSLYE